MCCGANGRPDGLADKRTRGASVEPAGGRECEQQVHSSHCQHLPQWKHVLSPKAVSVSSLWIDFFFCFAVEINVFGGC